MGLSNSIHIESCAGTTGAGLSNCGSSWSLAHDSARRVLSRFLAHSHSRNFASSGWVKTCSSHEGGGGGAEEREEEAEGSRGEKRDMMCVRGRALAKSTGSPRALPSALSHCLSHCRVHSSALGERTQSSDAHTSCAIIHIMFHHTQHVP